jgi:hypothetical protein
MRIPDISVSRIHAFIKYTQGKFILSDNRSKFGSLVKLQKPLMITDQRIAIQVGRTVFTFSTRVGREAAEKKGLYEARDRQGQAAVHMPRQEFREIRNPAPGYQ